MDTLRISLIDRSRDPGSSLSSALQELFASCRFRIDVLRAPELSIKAHLEQVLHRSSDIIVLILSREFDREDRALVEAFARRPERIPVIATIEEGSTENVLEILRLGAVDFLTPPIKRADVLPRMWRVVEHRDQGTTLLHTLKTRIGLKQMIGDSPLFRQVIDTIPMIAASDVGVQISGETGTGKELCARAIHYLGPRAGKPFLPVNCGAIPADLAENELFGHVRGAFTGADRSSEGLLQEAQGGTLFLDEIDCLPLQAQIKLLRVLQEKEYRQLGSPRIRQADVRVIAATSIDLNRAVQEGSFRQDLFYRLNVVHLSLPPLRERREDIPLLARHFLAQCAADAGKDITGFSPAAISLLREYGWPGNVRELENIVKRAVVFAMGNIVQEDDLALPRQVTTAPCESFKEEKAKVVAEFEREYMQGLLRAHQGNITQAARAAKKNRRAFWELLRKYQIDAESYRTSDPNLGR